MRLIRERMRKNHHFYVNDDNQYKMKKNREVNVTDYEEAQL